MIEIDNSDGQDETMRGLVLAVLDTNPNVGAVYSIGGGNMAIVEAFASGQRTYSVFIAHDLDQDNTRLIRDGRISAVLHHDLRQDMRQPPMRSCRRTRRYLVPFAPGYRILTS
jgi:LacI family transcriptional regulator, galactose operon repressor